MVLAQMNSFLSIVTCFLQVDGITGITYTFSRLRSMVRCVGSGLARAGFERGDVLCVMLPNIPEYAIIFYAVAAIGGVVTMINPHCTRGNIVILTVGHGNCGQNINYSTKSTTQLCSCSETPTKSISKLYSLYVVLIVTNIHCFSHYINYKIQCFIYTQCTLST